MTKKGNKFLYELKFSQERDFEQAKEAILNSFVKFMTTPAVIICETDDVPVPKKNLHSTNKNEERSLKLDLFKYSSDYSHFSAMNVKHLITNWQDFLHKNI